MSEKHELPLSVGQIDADLYVSKKAIEKAETLSSKAGKHLRGLAGYHLQQAAEKMIKIQIYASGVQIDNTKMYRHSLNDLIKYAESLGIQITVPAWILEKKFIISRWEAEGRYNLHFVVRTDTLRRCFREIEDWRNKQFSAQKIRSTKEKVE